MKLQTVIVIVAFFITECTQNAPHSQKGISPGEKQFYNGKGIGPITDISIESGIDLVMAGRGEAIFQGKCVSCHQISTDRMIGPGLLGVTKRRRPEWIMNQMLAPSEMTKNDSLAKELKNIYLTQMTDMQLSEQDARDILEYFRQSDQIN